MLEYSLTHWLTFFSAAFILTLSPGPDLAFFFGANHQRRAQIRLRRHAGHLGRNIGPYHLGDYRPVGSDHRFGLVERLALVGK